jgi:Asp/Glu/hydantoin racemase
MKRISIIPPIPLTEAEFKRRKNQYTLYSSTDIEIEIRMLKGGPLLTDNEKDLCLAGKYMIEEALLSEKEGSNAVIIDCTTDPGILMMEKLLNIPVLGSLRSGIQIALKNEKAFSVLALDRSWAEMINKKINEYNMTENLVSIETVGMHIYNPGRNGDMSNHEFRKFFLQLQKAGEQAIEKGAGSLILGSTTIIRGWKELENELGVSVIAPGIAALKDAEKIISPKLL